MGYFVLALPFFGLFAISFAVERRRMINAVLLGVVVFLVLIGVLAELMDSPFFGRWLTGEVVVLGFLFVTLVLLPGLLVANGIVMLKREGRRLGNLLSLLAGLGIFAFTPTLLLVGKGMFPHPVEILLICVGIAVGYASAVFALFLLYSVVYGLIGHRSGVDYIVVLGARLIRGKVPPLLASRLDRARKVYTAERAMIITSGGQGGDEEQSEARGMADYLVTAGVPEDHILLEDRSATTRENLLNSKEIMTARTPKYRCVVVTNNFHTLRTALLARRLKVNGQVIGSRTALYYLPSATIREFVGFLRDYRLSNGICCGLLEASFLVPVFLA